MPLRHIEMQLVLDRILGVVVFLTIEVTPKMEVRLHPVLVKTRYPFHDVNLISNIVRLGVSLFMNLPACRCVTYDQIEQPQQIECSITIGPKTLHLELLVQR